MATDAQDSTREHEMYNNASMSSDNTTLAPIKTHHTSADDGDEADHKEALDLSKTKSIAETLSLPHEIAFVSIICMAQFMTQAGLSGTLAILHVIGDDFGITNPGTLSWLIAGYSLTIGTFILFSGRLGDMFGYKKLLLIGFAWFTLWSMVAGLSHYSNHVLFVFARVFQGIGPAIILPNGLAILGATYKPGKRKAMVFSIFAAMSPNGSIVGALFAGLFALKSWPWTFYSFAMALAVIAVLSVYIIPNPPPKDEVVGQTLKQKLINLDLPGAFTGITGLILINFAWNQAPIVGWQKAYIIVCLVLGFAFLAAFFVIEIKYSPAPLIPFDALSADVSFVIACIACGWGSFGVWIYYLWQYVELVRGASPLLATAWLSPVCISGVLASIFTGWLLGRVRPGVVMLIAMTFFLISMILLATVPIDQIYWGQIFFSVIIGPWGMDMSFPAGTLILSNAVAKEHQGIAASLINTVVNYSISLALGFAGTIEVQTNTGETPQELLIGYRAAMYFAVGLAGLGLATSLAFLGKSYWDDSKRDRQLKEKA